MYWIVCTSIISVCTVNITNAQDFSRRVDSLFRQWDNTESPGCSLAIVKDGEIIYEKGYGMANLMYGIPNAPDTKYRIASSSKQFTSMAVLLLDEEGLLDISDNIRVHLPEVPDFGHRITIDNLMFHTSGIRDYFGLMIFGGWNLFADQIDRDQIRSLVANQKALNFNTGEQFLYSNTGYFLMGEIVERVSGQSLAEFSQERIFQPLRMNDSGFRENDSEILENYAAQYVADEDENYYQVSMSFHSVGEAGVISTVRDLAKWDENFYTATVGSQDLIEKLHEVGRLQNGTPTGYSRGVIASEINGRAFVYHGGDILGYHSQTLRFPDEHFSVLLIANTSELDSNMLLQKAFQISDFYFDNPPTDVSNFAIHEPNPFNAGFDGELLQSLDVPMDQFLRELYLIKGGKKQQHTEPLVFPSITEADAQEFLGRYYCEEVDGFISILFDEEEQDIIFQTPRFRPSLFTANRVRSDRIFFNDVNAILDANFFRNDEDEVAGFTISNPRTLNIEFRKAEIVTK